MDFDPKTDKWVCGFCNTTEPDHGDHPDREGDPQ